jgi:hypothetical protein
MSHALLRYCLHDTINDRLVSVTDRELYALKSTCIIEFDKFEVEKNNESDVY